MIYLHDLLGLIREVLLNLTIRELEDLYLVREGRLCCLCLCEIVDYFTVWVGLLDVLVVEVDNSVAIREGFSLDAIVEDDFFLTAGIDSLDLAIMAHVLVYYLGIGC